MKLIGFNFKKLSAERISSNLEGLKINTSINIISIEEKKYDSFNSKDLILIIEFSYSINYDSDIAKIEIIGNIILNAEEELGKTIINDWKEKKLNEEIRLKLFNLILRKSNIKALQLEEEVNLPPHFNLPSLKIESKK